jgi:diacylglycerol O-acyltransferase
MVSVPPAVDLPAGHIVDLPGRGSTFVVDTGAPLDCAERPPVVLLHALACTGLLTWYPTIAALRSQYRVITFDQRWHGQGIRSQTFRLEDCADDVAAVLDALAVDRAIVAGYSMGSLITQLTWHQQRDRVAGIVLGAGTARFTRDGSNPASLRVVSTRLARAATRRQAAISAGVIAQGVTAATLVSPTDHNRWAFAQLRSTTASGIAGAAAVISRFDSSPWVHGIDVPTAVVITAQDRLIPAERQRWLARQIRGATQYEVPAGHAAVVMAAERFIPAMQAAVASVAGRVCAPR